MRGGGSTYQALPYVNSRVSSHISFLDSFGKAQQGGRTSCRTRAGGGSLYQPLAYMMRGGGTRKRIRGGFYPSLMGGVLSNGPLLVSAAVAQGARLLRNESDRMKLRHRMTRKNTSKRTSKSRKNTRKA